jgi:signal peptidase I
MAENHIQVALELSRSGLEAGKRLRLRVVGESMLPLLREGDAVWVEQPRQELLQPGDLLVIELNGELIVHRLIAIKPAILLTKGDHVPSSDSWQEPERMIGSVVAIDMPGKRRTLEHRAWRWLGRFLAGVSLFEAQACNWLGKLEKPRPGGQPAWWVKLAQRLVLFCTRVPFELVKYAWR